MSNPNFKTRINHQIRVPEVRVISSEGQNLGIMSLSDALRAAQDAGLDLIEISPNAVPPIAKIADYGKYQYEEKKKMRNAKSKAKTVEVKTVQVKIGTGEHDLMLKAAKTSEWLKEGHRVKLDLFLKGRSKFMDMKFLKERLDRMLVFVTEKYKIADAPVKSPKGITVILEKAN
ncbi:MAG: translation initiation factor IF-3 [bacterium]